MRIVRFGLVINKRSLLNLRGGFWFTGFNFIEIRDEDLRNLIDSVEERSETHRCQCRFRRILREIFLQLVLPIRNESFNFPRTNIWM